MTARDDPRMPEWSVDVLLWQELDVDRAFAELLLRQVGVEAEIVSSRAKPWHGRGNGETDLLLLVTTSGGQELELHIENKVDAQWSDPTQPQRYRDHVEALPNAFALVIAPKRWLGAHDLGIQLFDGSMSYEDLADWLDEHNGEDARRQWVVERIRSASRAPVRGENEAATDVEAWVAALAAIAHEFDLRPKTTGYLRKRGTEGKPGRFIPDLDPLPGPGNPTLWYKLGKPNVRATRVDLAWTRPEVGLAERIAGTAVAHGFEAVWSAAGSELYVRVDGGDVFGGLTATMPVEDQIDEARAMFEAASGLRDWWSRGKVLEAPD